MIVASLMLLIPSSPPQSWDEPCPPATVRHEGEGPTDDVIAVGCVDAAGKSTGPYAELNFDRTVRRTGGWKDGAAHGLWLTWDARGVLSELTYVSGKREGVSFVRSSRTRNIRELGSYRDDFPDGHWHWFAEDGRLLGSSQFIDGSGELLFFGDDGRKGASLRFVAREPVEHTSYYSDGRIERRVFERSKTTSPQEGVGRRKR
jgi:hypothetical protein